MISHNLLTHVATPDRDAIIRHDRTALRSIEEWLSDPRFERLRPQLQTMKNRLVIFVTQAGPE